MAYGESKTPPLKRDITVSKARTLDLNIRGFDVPVTPVRAPQGNDENLLLNRDVFNKVAFNNTIDTNFNELDQLEPDLSFFDPNLATVEDFFNIYQNLFFTIPKFGDLNSHQYLVVESTEYTKFIENQEQIDALLEEIVELREENLQLQLDINELLGVKTTLDQAIAQTNGDGSLEELLQAEADLGAAQSNSSDSGNLTPSIPGVNIFPPSNPGGFGGGSGGSGGGGGGGGIAGVTSGFTDAFSSNENNQYGEPVPGFGFGGRPNTNNNVY